VQAHTALDNPNRIGGLIATMRDDAIVTKVFRSVAFAGDAAGKKPAPAVATTFIERSKRRQTSCVDRDAFGKLCAYRKDGRDRG
jgi:hypothetical protein